MFVLIVKLDNCSTKDVRSLHNTSTVVLIVRNPQETTNLGAFLLMILELVDSCGRIIATIVKSCKENYLQLNE